jgi:hypothetical protein
VPAGARVAAVMLALALLGAACGTDSVAVDAAPAPGAAGDPATTTNPPPETTSGTPPATAPPPTTVAPTTAAPADPEPPATLSVEGDPLLEFSVDVGEGVDLTRDELARFVVDTLTDPRSWVGQGVGFRLVDEGGDFTIVVAEPDRVDELCAPLRTNGIYSCARNGRVAINSLRWFGATDDWDADLVTYRRYLVNHEIGHYILGPGHDPCPAPGRPAPIMMQQTKGLDGCTANGWVDPDLSAAE